MHLLASHPSAIVFLAMFEDFTATDRWTKKRVHCVYQALIVAIATRHADAVDVKFLVDGRTVWVALPHPAWVEYKKRTGRAITDSLAIEIAGHYLKAALRGRRRSGPGHVLAYDRGDAGASERCRCRHAVCNPGLESASLRPGFAQAGKPRRLSPLQHL